MCPLISMHRFVHIFVHSGCFVCLFVFGSLLFGLCLQCNFLFSVCLCVCVCVWCCLLCDCSFMKLGGPCFIVVRLIVSLHLATCLCIFSLGSFRGSPPLGNLYMLFGFSWGSEIHMWCHFGVPPLGLTEFGYDVHSY